jgi:farnesyl-diphosphate farnesyltransferase
MSKLVNSEIDSMLEETSRSFYLTLKALPNGVRSQVGLLYLLARGADTIADSDEGEIDERLDSLSQYNERLQGNSDSLPDLTALAGLQSNPAEAKLLQKLALPVACLDQFSEVDKLRLRECLGIIISGQALDLQRFGGAEAGNPVPLADENELDDYTYRVAGSVGEFWTHMSLEHLFETDAETRKKLFETGVRFGKALQLINILRDIPEDLRLGRCYIPEPDLAAHGLSPSDLLDANNMERFRPLFEGYIDKAEAHLDAAVDYIGMLPHRQYRLRGACMLPVLIGQRTLILLRTSNVLDGENRVKVLRPEIKRLKNQTIRAILFRGRSQRLLNKNRMKLD